MSLLILALLVGAAALALHHPRRGLGATLGVGVVMLLLWRGQMPVWSWLWLPWLLLLLWSLTPVRLLLVTLPVMQLIRRKLPPISDTERDAIAAGTTWWESDLFGGYPDWRKLLAFPPAKLTLEEQAFLDVTVEQLCQMLDDWAINRDHDLPPEVWQFLREKGFFGLIIPKEYGGHGFSHEAHSRIVGKIASRSISAGITVMVPNSLGPAELLLHYGSEEQKNHYLPRLARGEDIPCFALTGPTAGSDAGSIPDTGIVCRGLHDGQEVLGIRLNWDKRYITLAPVATVLGLAFQLRDPDHLLGSAEAPGITLALIPADHPGVEIGRRHLPAGQAFMNGPTRGHDVFIPINWIIGGREYAGRGWSMLMNSLAAGRGISLPAAGTTTAKQMARLTGMYARVRRQFGLAIGKLEGVEEALARIGAQAYALEAARRLTCAGLDLGEKPAVVSGLMKYQAVERMRAVVNDAMDIHAGKGICEGPRNYLANVYRSVPVGITVEGANILTRSLIVFGQGAMRCHPFLMKEIELAAHADVDPQQAEAAFDAVLVDHTRHLVGNMVRAFLHGLSFAMFAKAPRTPTARWYRQLARLSASFAFVSDVTLALLGGELKRREKLSGRFADILAELYFASATLKRWEDDGRPEPDRALVDYALAQSICTIEQRLSDILRNFPVPVLGVVLRLLVFPLGRRQHAPADALGHRVASLMLKPSTTQQRLSDGLFVSHNRFDATGALEYAFLRVEDTEAIARKLHDAVKAGTLREETPEAGLRGGVLTSGEAQLLQEAEEAVREVIRVDDFAWQELAAVSSERRPHAA